MTKQVAALKKREKLPVFDGNRERLQIEKIREIAEQHAIDPDVVEKLFDIYVAYCRQEMAKEMT
ncbi:chorismate mutase [Simkania sp.]|uniref:chorismate mutase n=1 Tax=Simkania sp. TaxID=34094 RepID=UPI003B517EE5